MPQKKQTQMSAPETCPVCGEDVPRNALACPECGADHNSGWSEQAAYDGLDLPGESFDYDEFVRQEFGDSRKSGINLLWWITGVLLLLALIIFYFYNAR